MAERCSIAMDFVTHYAWLIWLGLILIFLIVEMTTLEFTFLMIAIGSLGGLISGLFGLEWWAQIVIAAVLALLLLGLVKPALLKRLKKGADPALTLIEALIGMEATALKDFKNKAGQVKLAVGETWTARLEDGGKGTVREGDLLKVVGIEGATAVVAPAGKESK